MRNYEKIEHFVNQMKEGSLIYKDGSLYRNGRKIEGSKNGKGNYLSIDTKKDMKKVRAFMHLVIFAYFHGIEELKKHETIDHTNGDKYDNRIENLQGMTRFENSQKDSGGKLSQEDARVIKQRLSEGETTVKLASDFGVSVTTISKIKRGLRFKNA